MARFFINCVAEEKQLSKFPPTQRENSTMLGLPEYQRYMYSRNHYLIIQSFKWVSLHGLEFFPEFVRQLKASRNMELTDSVYCNSLKFPSHVTSMIFHLVFCWPHRGRLSMGNISVKFTASRMVNGKTWE